MPPSRKDRRSQAWWTFMSNQAITIQSRSFQRAYLARELLSQVRSRSQVFTYHLAAFVVAPITDPSCCNVWHTVPLLVAVPRPNVQFTRIATLTTKFTALACRCRTAVRKAGHLTTIDRIRDPPAAQQLKRHADRSSMRSTSKRASFARPTRRDSTASAEQRGKCHRRYQCNNMERPSQVRHEISNSSR
jgi:hypothetical protein